MQALTTNQYKELIGALKSGVGSHRANPRVAAALITEANLGMRIGDVLHLRLADIICDGGRYRLNIIEEKTGKRRTFTVPAEILSFLRAYADSMGLAPTDTLFPLTVRQVQRHLRNVCEALGYENISTHSFRKWYATDIYEQNGHDIILVQKLLQHSSPETTRRYIGIAEERVEKAIAGHVLLA